MVAGSHEGGSSRATRVYLCCSDRVDDLGDRLGLSMVGVRAEGMCESSLEGDDSRDA